MAARTRKIRHDDETRAKIQTSQLVNRLTDHALGKVEMPSTAVTAALGLLKKTLPDLSQSDVTHTNKREATDYTREELVAILRNATDGSSRAAKAGGCEAEPDSVH